MFEIGLKVWGAASNIIFPAEKGLPNSNPKNASELVESLRIVWFLISMALGFQNFVQGVLLKKRIPQYCLKNVKLDIFN